MMRDCAVIISDDAGLVLGDGQVGVNVDSVAGWPQSAPLQHDRQKRWGHGSITGISTRTGRGYIVEGVTEGLTHDTARDHMLYVTSLFTGLGYGTLSVRHAGLELTANVRLDGEILVSDQTSPFGWVRWQIPLWADDPMRYGPVRRVLIQPLGSGIGLDYNLFTHGGILTYGQAQNTTLVLENYGDAPSWPSVEVFVDDPSGFRLRLDGHTVEYGGPCSSAAPVTVDMSGAISAGAALLRRREWAAIPPGASSTLTLETLQGGPGYGWVTIQDTYN